jgi:hypothetical protein
MALPNPIPIVQGSRLLLGPDSAGTEATFLINPGNSDYPVGGYVIPAFQLGLKLIACAWVSGWNDLAAGFSPQIVFDLRQLASPILGGGVGGPGQGLPFSQTAGPGITGYPQLNFQIRTGAAAQGRLTEATVNTDFEGCGWLLTVRGQ